MCCSLRQLDPKSRRIYAAGNVCLATSIALTLFAEPFHCGHPALFNLLRFSLILAAIALLRWSACRGGACAPRH